MIKKLEENSRFNKYDINRDGTVTDEEMARAKDMLELELREEKTEQQQRMALSLIHISEPTRRS